MSTTYKSKIIRIVLIVRARLRKVRMTYNLLLISKTCSSHWISIKESSTHKFLLNLVQQDSTLREMDARNLLSWRGFIRYFIGFRKKSSASFMSTRLKNHFNHFLYRSRLVLTFSLISMGLTGFNKTYICSCSQTHSIFKKPSEEAKRLLLALAPPSPSPFLSLNFNSAPAQVL